MSILNTWNIVLLYNSRHHNKMSAKFAKKKIDIDILAVYNAYQWIEIGNQLD